MGLFEQSKGSNVQIDKKANPQSQSIIISEGQNTEKKSFLRQNLDLECLQNFIEMIDSQKRRIMGIQKGLIIFNILVTLIFTFTCLCEVFKIFGENEVIMGVLLYLGPLYLTCIVFVIALCKIQTSIKAINIARIHQMMICIHFFNLITYTLLGTAYEAIALLRNKYDPDGDQQQ